MKRLPSLDGLRAVSIAFVVAGHILGAALSAAGNGNARYWEIIANGSLGVFIFFVISGYIITLLLLNEFESTRAIDLGRFYGRRAFRILPPLYFYILFLFATAGLTGISITLGQAVSSAAFVQNMSPWADGWVLEHTWSLSVEEQFYLLWPIGLLLTMRRSGRTAAIKLATALIIAAPLFRLTLFGLFHGTFIEKHVTSLLPARMDALMFGCVTALASGSEWFEFLYRQISRIWWYLPIQVVLISGFLGVRYGNYYTLSVGQTLDGVCVAAFLVWCLRNSQSMVGRALNSWPVVHVGIISYDIYIWQTYFLHAANQTVFGRLPWSLFAILCISEFSYFVIEGASRKLRDCLIGGRTARSRFATRPESSA